MIRPLLDYCDVIYDSCTMYESERLDKLQRKASLLCTGAFRITSNEKELGWSKLAKRRTNQMLVLFYKLLNNLAPQYLNHLCNLTSHNTNNYLLRRNNSFLVPTIHRESFYHPTKGYSFGVVRQSTLFVCPEPYLSTYWSDLFILGTND